MSGEFDVIVVGAGPAGLSTAYFLAKKGFSVVVLERGSEPGSKNVFGGRVYSYVLDKNMPGWRMDAPIERWVRREGLSILCHDGSSINLQYIINRSSDGYDSFTTFLTEFLKWFSYKVEEAGGTIATRVKVDKLIFEGGRAVGVEAGGEIIRSYYVVIAEGANTLLLEKHGLRCRPKPEDISVGVKEVIKLKKETIDERFSLEDDEGVAYFILYPRLGGGGFIYTMREYVSIGVVYRPSFSLNIEARDVIEELRTHPQILKLVRDGVLVEYSAHMIREAGYRDFMEKPYGVGYLVVGDAAGLLINTGFTVRGVDIAIESGRIAAEAIEKAGTPDDLSIYRKLLEENHVISKLEKFKKTPNILSNNRLYTYYPEILCKIFSKTYTVEEELYTLRESIHESVGGLTSLIKIFLELVRAVSSL
ncbi:MAG: FAD-dependent oxidoreductase [Nitrososphaerota archaeon]